MKSLLTTLLLITGISMAQPPNQPSVPQTMSFQAMITDTLGVPITDGTHNFTSVSYTHLTLPTPPYV